MMASRGRRAPCRKNSKAMASVETACRVSATAPLAGNAIAKAMVASMMSRKRS